MYRTGGFRSGSAQKSFISYSVPVPVLYFSVHNLGTHWGYLLLTIAQQEMAASTQQAGSGAGYGKPLYKIEQVTGLCGEEDAIGPMAKLGTSIVTHKTGATFYENLASRPAERAQDPLLPDNV
jgi:hypothetical protein